MRGSSETIGAIAARACQGASRTRQSREVSNCDHSRLEPARDRSEVSLRGALERAGYCAQGARRP